MLDTSENETLLLRDQLQPGCIYKVVKSKFMLNDIVLCIAYGAFPDFEKILVSIKKDHYGSSWPSFCILASHVQDNYLMASNKGPNSAWYIDDRFVLLGQLEAI